MCEAFLAGGAARPIGQNRQVHRLRGQPDTCDCAHQGFERAAARNRRHHHLAHPGCLVAWRRSFATANARSASLCRWTCSPPATTAVICSTSCSCAQSSRLPNTSRSKGAARGFLPFVVGNTEYEKKNFFLLDFCAVAEYFEEKYDYVAPLESSARAAKNRTLRHSGPASGRRPGNP